MTCNKDTTDLDCLDCPYGYDDDEAVYCGFRVTKIVYRCKYCKKRKVRKYW